MEGRNGAAQHTSHNSTHTSTEQEEKPGNEVEARASYITSRVYSRNRPIRPYSKNRTWAGFHVRRVNTNLHYAPIYLFFNYGQSCTPE